MYQFKKDKQFTNRDNFSVQLYLADVSRLPMIGIDEEVELAKMIRKGGAIAAKAKEKLVNANLRFVVSVAKAYQHMGMELGDLISEGNIGLMTAAEKFDHTRGFKFVSYAVWWIRQSITQALAEYGRIVRMPVNQLNMMHKIDRLFDQISMKEGRIPTDEEIGDAIGLTAEEVHECKSHNGKGKSIDEPMADDSETTFADTLKNDYADETDAKLIKESVRSKLESSMSGLSKRDKKIIHMCFGMDGSEMTCGEIGARLNLTSERVRQLKEHALDAMRQRLTGKVI